MPSPFANEEAQLSSPFADEEAGLADRPFSAEEGALGSGQNLDLSARYRKKAAGKTLRGAAKSAVTANIMATKEAGTPNGGYWKGVAEEAAPLVSQAAAALPEVKLTSPKLSKFLPGGSYDPQMSGQGGQQAVERGAKQGVGVALNVLGTPAKLAESAVTAPFIAAQKSEAARAGETPPEPRNFWARYPGELYGQTAAGKFMGPTGEQDVENWREAHPVAGGLSVGLAEGVAPMVLDPTNAISFGGKGGADVLARQVSEAAKVSGGIGPSMPSLVREIQTLQTTGNLSATTAAKAAQRVGLDAKLFSETLLSRDPGIAGTSVFGKEVAPELAPGPPAAAEFRPRPGAAMGLNVPVQEGSQFLALRRVGTEPPISPRGSETLLSRLKNAPADTALEAWKSAVLSNPPTAAGVAMIHGFSAALGGAKRGETALEAAQLARAQEALLNGNPDKLAAIAGKTVDLPGGVTTTLGELRDLYLTQTGGSGFLSRAPYSAGGKGLLKGATGALPILGMSAGPLGAAAGLAAARSKRTLDVFSAAGQYATFIDALKDGLSPAQATERVMKFTMPWTRGGPVAQGATKLFPFASASVGGAKAALSAAKETPGAVTGIDKAEQILKHSQMQNTGLTDQDLTPSQQRSNVIPLTRQTALNVRTPIGDLQMGAAVMAKAIQGDLKGAVEDMKTEIGNKLGPAKIPIEWAAGHTVPYGKSLEDEVPVGGKLSEAFLRAIGVDVHTRSPQPGLPEQAYASRGAVSRLRELVPGMPERDAAAEMAEGAPTTTGQLRAVGLPVTEINPEKARGTAQSALSEKVRRVQQKTSRSALSKEPRRFLTKQPEAQ